VRHVRLAIALGLLLIAAGLAHTLLAREAPYLGDNNRDIQLLRGTRLLPGERACQAGETVPRGTGAVLIATSTAGKPGGPFEVTVASGGRVVGRGQGGDGVVDKSVSVPLGNLRRGVAPATVCVRNAGDRPAAILGQGVAGPPFVRIAGHSRALHNALRFEWYKAGNPMRIAQVGDVARRYGLVKPSFFGTWTFWVALALLVAMSAAAIRLVAREVRT
jgi:hypothetical protein